MFNLSALQLKMRTVNFQGDKQFISLFCFLLSVDSKVLEFKHREVHQFFWRASFLYALRIAESAGFNPPGRKRGGYFPDKFRRMKVYGFQKIKKSTAING